MALVAVMLGLIALFIGLVEPTGNTMQGWAVTTAGVSAIAMGSSAAQRARWGSRAVRVLARTAVALGGVGSALMLYALLAALLSPGIILPPLSLARALDLGTTAAQNSANQPAVFPARPSSAPEASAPRPAVQPAGQVPPSPATDDGPTGAQAWVPTDAASEARAVSAAVQDVADAMHTHYPDGGYPNSLVESEGTDARLLLPDGTLLSPIPNGARVAYRVSPDGQSWTLTIQGASFGRQATYDSATNVVTQG